MRASAAGGFGPPMAAPSNLRVCDDARHPADGGEGETVRLRIAARAPARDFCSARSRAERPATSFRRVAALRQGAAAGCRRLRRLSCAFADGGGRASSGPPRGLPSAAWGGGERHALKRGLVRTNACERPPTAAARDTHSVCSLRRDATCGPKAGRSSGPPTSARSKPFGNELQPADPSRDRNRCDRPAAERSGLRRALARSSPPPEGGCGLTR